MYVLAYHVHMRQKRPSNEHDIFHLFAKRAQLAGVQDEHFFNIVLSQQAVRGDQTDWSRQSFVQNYDLRTIHYY